MNVVITGVANVKINRLAVLLFLTGNLAVVRSHYDYKLIK
jgi:hypothetical protein